MSNPLNVSVSGGRSSMFMARLIQQSDYSQYELHYLFCNTGKEDDRTLDFVRDCQINWGLPVVWLEAVINPEKGVGTAHKVVSYETATRYNDRGPFDDLIAKYGVPNKGFKHCTRELKIQAMASYMRSMGYCKWTTAIGFRFDEPQRITGKTSFGPAIYPLYELLLRRQSIRLWWKEQAFDLQMEDYEGNCRLCMLKSLPKKVRIVKDDPSVVWWWEQMERQYPDRPFDVRDCVSMAELREIAESKRKLLVYAQGEFPCMCGED